MQSESNYLKSELYNLIREDSAIFDFLQSGSLDGMWYWDLDNPSEGWMSERFWTTLGYDPELMPHKSDAWQNIIDPGDLELAFANFKKHCDDPSHPYDQIVRYRHKNGSTVWIRCRGLAIRNDQGTPIRMLGAHTDITAIKEAEAQLAEQKTKLKAANAELTNFSYAASHDIQGPIATLVGLLDALTEDIDKQIDEDGRKLLAMANLSAHRLKELTHGILEYARCGREAHELDRSHFNCNELLAEVRTDLQQEIQAARAELVVDDLPSIKALKAPTRQLFQNLISNALKFRRSDAAHATVVTINCRPIFDGWEFSVSDNGIGMNLEQQDKIFNAFSRLNNASKFSGNGLGLALCQRVVETHGGRIWVESTPNQGSRFTFTYPDSKIESIAISA
ncbi:MAG: PAS domain-containing protein [Granulosicoccus sp.]|nr:PAS domain-containing protein [Granulosicoccus sp.]